MQHSTKSYQQRILPNFEEAFMPIWNTLIQHFWPAIFEGTVSNHKKQLFSIPDDWVAREFAQSNGKCQNCLYHIWSRHKKHCGCHQRKGGVLST